MEYFTNPNRPKAVDSNCASFEDDKSYALNFLYNFYSTLRKRDIDKVFKSVDYDLVLTCDKLDCFPRAFQMPRNLLEKLDTKNLTLVQEVIKSLFSKNKILCFELSR